MESLFIQLSDEAYISIKKWPLWLVLWSRVTYDDKQCITCANIINLSLVPSPDPVVVQQQCFESLQQRKPIQFSDLIIRQINGIKLIECGAQILQHRELIAYKHTIWSYSHITHINEWFAYERWRWTHRAGRALCPAQRWCTAPPARLTPPSASPCQPLRGKTCEEWVWAARDEFDQKFIMNV